MPSPRFLERSLRLLEAHSEQEQARRRPRLRRTLAAGAGLALAAGAFFVLKGAVLASGAALPGAEGAALWLAGPDPVASALAAALEPLFAPQS